jgi:excisionase family DNA binding protein
MIELDKGRPNHPVLDLRHLGDVPTDQIPVLLAQLAAASQQLVARLLSSDVHEEKIANGSRHLTVSATAERTGMSRDYLYRNAEKLPFALRVGRSVRFSEAGLEKWIRSRSGR